MADLDTLPACLHFTALGEGNEPARVEVHVGSNGGLPAWYVVLSSTSGRDCDRENDTLFTPAEARRVAVGLLRMAERAEAMPGKDERVGR